MLQKINERIQGFLAWIIILLITITFTLFGVEYYLQTKHDKTIQAAVNDDTIATHDFQMTYRRALRTQDSSVLTLAEEKNLKQRVLDDLILNAVMLNVAQNNGFSVSYNQANTAILQIPQFQSEGHFSPDRYVHALSNALFTPQTFEREVQQGMLLNQQRFAWVGTDFVLPTELKDFLTLYYQIRSYSYLQLPVDSFTQQVSVTTDDIQNYYKINTAKFLNPESIKIDYVLLSKKSLRKDVQISNAEIKQYYAENFNSAEPKKSLSEMQEIIREQLISEKIETEYTKLLEQLTDLSYQESESLHNVAKAMHLPLNHSELFSRAGGTTDLTKNPAIIRAAFSHDVLKFGNNSAPIAFGDEGAVVLRVTKHLHSAPKQLEEVKEEIIKQLQHVKAIELAHEVGENILHGNDSTEILHKYGLLWKQIPKAKRDSDQPSAKINELVFDMTKSHPRIGQELENGDYVILQLNDIIPGNLKKIDKELKTSIAQQMEANFGLLDYDLYVHNAMSIAKIVKY